MPSLTSQGTNMAAPQEFAPQPIIITEAQAQRDMEEALELHRNAVESGDIEARLHAGVVVVQKMDVLRQFIQIEASNN